MGGELPPSKTRLEELPLDSLELIEMLYHLEQLTGTYLSNTELASLRTVGDVVLTFVPSGSTPGA